uniref:Uncharacterized protein n=1 Tax=Arundo donax TaxID=35708 RepID=A0A0A9GBW1_ARUDO
MGVREGLEDAGGLSVVAGDDACEEKGVEGAGGGGGLEGGDGVGEEAGVAEENDGLGRVAGDEDGGGEVAERVRGGGELRCGER